MTPGTKLGSHEILSQIGAARRGIHMIDDLYEAIGGKHTIWAATDAFYRRVLEDRSLRHFFDSTDMAHLRARQSMFVSMLLGGRAVYTGKEMARRMHMREPRG
jgi:truncated hemoglobin YjbI